MLALALWVLVLGAVRSIEICDCSGACPSVCQTHPLASCTQQLDLCTGSPIVGSYMNITDIGNFQTIGIDFFNDSGCANEVDGLNYGNCGECLLWPSSVEFNGTLQNCPQRPPECDVEVHMFEENSICTGTRTCIGYTKTSGVCDDTGLGDGRKVSYVPNCTAKTLQVFYPDPGDNCTGPEVASDVEELECVSLATNFSVRFVFNDSIPCGYDPPPSDGDGTATTSGDGDGNTTSSGDGNGDAASALSGLFWWYH